MRVNAKKPHDNVRLFLLFDRVFAADYPYEKQDDRRYQQDVDEPSEHMGCYDSQQPEYQQDDPNSNEHIKFKLNNYREKATFPTTYYNTTPRPNLLQCHCAAILI